MTTEVDTKPYEHGISPNDIGSYSLRADGTMALKLNGISDTTIKRLNSGHILCSCSIHTTGSTICLQVYHRL